MVIRCGELSKPIILVLDFDGVITRLDIDWKLVRAEASKIVGYHISSLVRFFEENFGKQCFYTVSKLVEQYEMRAVEKAEPYSDVVKLLTLVKDIPVYIATMQSEKVVEFFLKKHSLTKFFTDILGRNRFGSKRRQLEYLINNVNTIPSRIVFVDDSWRNISICKELGLKCIWLRRDKNMTLLNIINILNTS